MERKSNKLDTLPLIVNKRCLIESLSETISDNHAVIFLEYQQVTEDNDRVIGHTAIISVVGSDYLNDMLMLHAQITDKKEFLDLRELTWQEIKNKEIGRVKVIKVTE